MNDSQGVFDFPFLSTMQSYEPLSLNMGRIERVGQFNAASSSSASSASPASRQKSCNACVRGKRRCDKTAPRCTRCAAKGLDCVYQRVPPGSSPSSVTLAGSGADARLSDADMACVVGAADPDLPDDFEMDMGGFDVSVSEMSGGGGQHGSSTSATTTTATTSPDSLALDPNLEFSIVDLLGNGSGSGDAGDSGSSLSGLWGLPGFSEPKADFPSLMVPPQPYNQQNQAIRDVAILEDHRSARKCMSIDPLLVHDPRSNIGFMVETLTNMHVGFVQSRAMPFIHPRLYHLNVPKTMMAAFCGASTYMTRTPSTRAWAFKAVQDATAEVHREGALAVTPLDKIARLHALLVLESIRFFDGDLGLRYASEREVGKLSEWSIEMLEVLDELDCREAAMSRDQPPATWDVSCPLLSLATIMSY